jgi:Adenylate cyclase, family 3 (some proteins contain HAMP domain)
MNFDKIKTTQSQVIALAGDLSGFSFSYSKGNIILVNEFIKRFYYLVNKLISFSGGEVVKFTGDGFLAIWPLTKSNFDKNYHIAKIVETVAQKLSRLIRWTKLDMQITEQLTLRQGLTVEHNAINVKFLSKQECTNDYLGEMINFAFRIQNLANNYPYVCIHKNFLDLLPKEILKNYKPIDVSDSDLVKIFKGLHIDKSKIYTITSLSEETLNRIYEDMCNNISQGISDAEFAKSKVIEAEYLVENPNQKVVTQINIKNKLESAFYSQINILRKEGPKWVSNCFFKEWAFIKTMSIYVYNLNKNFLITNQTM